MQKCTHRHLQDFFKVFFGMANKANSSAIKALFAAPNKEGQSKESKDSKKEKTNENDKTKIHKTKKKVLQLKIKILMRAPLMF